MKAAVVHDFAQPLRVEDVPKTEPGDGEVVVKIETSGLCHTDVHAAHDDWLGTDYTVNAREQDPVEEIKKLGGSETVISTAVVREMLTSALRARHRFKRRCRMTKIVVPWSGTDIQNGGLVTVEGVAEVDETGLSVQFTIKDPAGELTPDVQEVRFALDEISAVDLKTGPFGGRMTITTSNFAASTAVPGSRHGSVRLRVPRAGREAAKSAEALLTLRLAEKQLESFDRELER